jgi:uncharacterized protein (TIGR00730 family)
MRSYELGNPDLDETIRKLVAAASENPHQDLIAEIVVTALKLHRDGAPRGDLKLVNTALKEMRYSMLVFARHEEPKVTVFGSARLGEDDPNYQLTVDFARRMVQRGWGVVTGAGPGIMEAGNRGAGLESSYGVAIRLPFETHGNPYVSPERVVNFKYFFTRKLAFVKESNAFALLPGGFGTLDETFELLTLTQTGKSDLHPIVLLEAAGTNYWEALLGFMREVLVDRGLISPSDMDLFSFTTDPAAAAEEILHFYANYHSQRYVDGLLVLRMKQAPDAATVEQLNQEFADIVVGEPIQVIHPTPAERDDEDSLELERLAFRFDRRSFGRLRRLIDRLNDLVVTPEQVRPPAPFREEQQERPW